MTTQLEQQVVKLDVRPVLAAGGEPFDAIMEAAASLAEGGTLELTAPFDPVPLYRVLSGQGFAHATERRGDDEYVVRFSRVSITPDLTVGDVQRRYPGTGAVFAGHGIDLCCGGTKALEFAAQAHGLELGSLLDELRGAALRAP